MKTSLLHKDGVDLLVEEIMINNEIEDKLDDAKEATIKELPENDCCKSEIIELRNDYIIKNIEDENRAVSRILDVLGKYAFSKDVRLRDAITEVFKINLVLNTKYSMNDIFEGAEIKKEKECDDIHVKFNKMNFDIVEKYRDTLAKYVSYCHDCLFGDLYDKEALTKYLPVVYFLLSTNVC